MAGLLQLKTSDKVSFGKKSTRRHSDKRIPRISFIGILKTT
jgi:hypothetical protein